MTAGLFSNRTDEWGTPRALFAALDTEFHFTLDACATPDNAKCPYFFTMEQNGLLQDWGGFTVFVNPPYSESAAWLKKCHEEAQRSRADKKTVIVVLIPCRTDTRYFHDYCMKADEIRLIKGRLKYNDEPQSAPFPSGIFIFNGSNPEGPRLRACDAKGTMITP